MAWKPAFDEALQLADLGQMAAAAQRLEALAAEQGDVPVIWHNLAMVRAWLADPPGAAHAWRKYASLDVGPEAAAEAEATAMFLNGDPLGDTMDVLDVEYPVSDAEALNLALLSSPRASAIRADLSPLVEEGEPPPKSAFYLFDRPLLDSGQPPAMETLPKGLGQVVLWGKQTDRQARLVALSLPASALNAVQSYLGDVGGPLSPPLRRPWSIAPRPPASCCTATSACRTTPARKSCDRILDQYVQWTLYQQWPQFLGRAGRQDPAAGGRRGRLPGSRAGRHHGLRVHGSPDHQAVRRQSPAEPVGPARIGPIDPTQTAVNRLPLVRLARVEVDKLSDEQLLSCFRRAVAFNAREAVVRFAQSVVQRPSMAGQHKHRQQAFAALARHAAEAGESLGYIDKGREATVALGKSCASWDLMELSLRFEMRQAADVSRLLTHLQTRHLREAGVAQTLNRWLMSIGAIRPDGTPAAPPQEAAQAAADLAPGPAAAEPGKLWTPGSAAPPPGERPKIWTPDMG